MRFINSDIKLFNIAVFISLVVFVLSGCSTLNKIEDFAKDNPIVASASFRYATAKYIERSNSDSGQIERAALVIDTVSRINVFIAETESVTVAKIMGYLDSIIPWEGMDQSDRILIKELLSISEAYLGTHETASVDINIKELLDTIVSAALMYGA